MARDLWDSGQVRQGTVGGVEELPSGELLQVLESQTSCPTATVLLEEVLKEQTGRQDPGMTVSV